MRQDRTISLPAQEHDGACPSLPVKGSSKGATPSSPSAISIQNGRTSSEVKLDAGMSTAEAGNAKGGGDAGVRGVGQIVEGVLICHPLAASSCDAASTPVLAWCANSGFVHAGSVCFKAGAVTLRKMHG